VVEIKQIGGVRNFGWLEPGRLARGEQPPLDDNTLEALAAEGVLSVISLRREEEAEGPLAGRLVPQYSPDQQRLTCERAGLQFQHVACTDFEAPRPDDVANVLRAIDDEVEAGRPVFVHCRAGVGRTSIMTCAWLMAHGMAGDEAAAIHVQFIKQHDERLQIPPEQWDAYLKRVGRAESWWSLRQIAEALGTPITAEFSMPAPERPFEATGWEQWYRDVLEPWREALGR
jgi:protein tyrosine phosphatase (PTP) superfamily phosphohydrolase (DUF442 family)